MLDFPKSKQQKEFENLCKSILKIMADLQEWQQNDLCEYAIQLHKERNDKIKRSWDNR